MICRLKSIRFLLPILGIAAICMAGNPSAESRDPGKDWEHLRQLTQNTSLKAVIKSAGAIQGKWLSADETSLTILWDKNQRTIGREDVLQIYQLEKKSRGRRALIGAAIGAGGGLGAGAIVDASSDDDWFPNAGKQILTPMGGIVGAIIGAVWPTGHWQEIYRAPSPDAK